MRVRHAIAAVALLVASTPASAQISTWSGSASPNWSNPANWDEFPVSGADLQIVLTGGSNTSTVLDLGGGGSVTQLNRIDVLTSAPAGFSISPVGGRSFQVTGAAFTGTTGTNAEIQVGVDDARLTISAGIDFAALNTGLSPNGRRSSLVLSGPLTAPSSSTVTVAGLATAASVYLTGTNNTGFNGTLALTKPQRIVLGGNNAIGRGATVNTGSALDAGGVQVGIPGGDGFTETSTGQQIGALVGPVFNPLPDLPAGGFQLGTGALDTSANGQVLVGFLNTSTTFVGPLPASPGSLFAKVGTGTLTIGGASGGGGVFFGELSIRDGRLTLVRGGSLTHTERTGSLPPDVNLYAGATLFLNNGTSGARANNAPRLTATTFRAAGGTFQINQAGSATNGTVAVAESLGALTAISGQSTIFLDTTANGATQSVGLTFASGASANGGTVFFRGGNATTSNLGANAPVTAGTIGAATTTNVVFTTPPATSNGVIPWGIASTTSGTTPDTFAIYNATNGVQPLTTYASAFGATTDNVSIAGDATATAATANALRITSGTVTSNGLTLTSGALLMFNNTTMDGTGVTFGAPGTAYITTPGAAFISAPISATNLSKNGGGFLTINGSISLSAGAGNGLVAVNAGALSLTNVAGLTGATTFQVSRGADLLATALNVGNGQTLRGASNVVPVTGTTTGGVTGNVTVGSGGTITPSALAGPAADLASPATLGITGNLALQGGSNYTWYVSSALTDANGRSPYTAGNIVVNGVLDLSGASSESKINLRITSLTLANERGPLYDYNKLTDTRSWVIAEATGTNAAITGFSADKFNLDVSQFANYQAGDPNTFTISRVGNTLVLNVVPVPEPAAVLAVAAGALGVVTLVRRRRAATKV